jgi:hypothetical protein
MDNIDFITQFSIVPYKYIVLYIDNEIYNEDENNLLLKEIKNIDNNLNIIRFLSKDDNKENINLDQIYTDLYSEEILIKYCLCIIYLSKINRSEILINLIDLYEKYIIYNKKDIIQHINYVINNEELKLLNENKNIFKNIYQSLILNKNNIYDINIKIEYNKIIKKSINDKINIITYFKNSDIEILNIIQKKCIIENSKNKNTSKIIVLGDNINFGDNLNIELIEMKNEVTYKDLLDISNKLEKESIICILRSDIILPNQYELNSLNIDLFTNTENNIYSFSRIERLINGNLIKSEKLNRIFFSTELNFEWDNCHINCKKFHRSS